MAIVGYLLNAYVYYRAASVLWQSETVGRTEEGTHLLIMAQVFGAGALVMAGLWMVLAIFLTRAKPWARIVATVLGALCVLLSIAAVITEGLLLEAFSGLGFAFVLVALWQDSATHFLHREEV